MNLKEILETVGPGDPNVRREAARRWDSLAKPLGSLGVLEENVIKIAALTGNPQVRLQKRVLLVFCADNGVTAQGVSQSDETVTTAVATALGRGDSTVNYLARAADCQVIPVDVGMAEDTPAGVRNRKIQRSTGDIAVGPAMSREACIAAIRTGAELAMEQAAAGADILLLGEMGIGNTTTAAAVSSQLLGCDTDLLAGRGAGLSDAGLACKKRALHQSIAVNRTDPGDPIDLLQKLGGPDLAALCGACLGAAASRVPVLLDGVITDAAALCAVRLCPAAAHALIASHESREPAAKLLLEELGLCPMISAGLRLGEGSGAVLALGLLDRALEVYHSGHTFGALGIETYTPQ